VPIYNLYKEREGTARRGEDYKEVVIEYMEGLNYMVELDSAFHSTLDDIQFVNKATGDKVVAEAKAYSTGLSPNDFRDELARYFLEYIKQPQPHRFDFYIFTETSLMTSSGKPYSIEMSPIIRNWSTSTKTQRQRQR